MAATFLKIFPGHIREIASKMVSAARNRSRIKKYDFNLSQHWACKKLMDGKCEATGIAFDFSSSGKWRKHFPSIDRIDSKLGYTDDNCQMVTVQYNIAKGSWTNDDMLELCKAVVANFKNNKPKRKLGLKLRLGEEVRFRKNTEVVAVRYPTPPPVAAIPFLSRLVSSGIRESNNLYD